MKLAVFSVLTLGMAWGLAALGSADAGAGSDARTPVLVELFTSEGCSSCPPADALLATLASSQPVAGALVIPLSEHVDYWNHLGWADPDSSKRFSERQNAYAAFFRNAGVYTPQAVVDGRAELVGSDRSALQRAIATAAREAKLQVGVARGGTTSSLRVRVDPSTSVPEARGAQVLLAIVEGGLESSVSRGENSGKRLSHTAVVRRLEVIGLVPDAGAFEKEIPVTLDPTWKPGNLSAVAFVQERPSGKVLGAARGAL
jgi:hypothetical protein